MDPFPGSCKSGIVKKTRFSALRLKKSPSGVILIDYEIFRDPLRRARGVSALRRGAGNPQHNRSARAARNDAAARLRPPFRREGGAAHRLRRHGAGQFDLSPQRRGGDGRHAQSLRLRHLSTVTTSGSPATTTTNSAATPCSGWCVRFAARCSRRTGSSPRREHGSFSSETACAVRSSA